MTQRATAMQCQVCDHEITYQWFDHHGVAGCWTCNAAYRLYHYENGKRTEEPAKLLLTPAWLSLARQYWTDTHCRIPAPGLNFPGSDPALAGDYEAWRNWTEAHQLECKAAAAAADDGE